MSESVLKIVDEHLEARGEFTAIRTLAKAIDALAEETHRRLSALESKPAEPAPPQRRGTLGGLTSNEMDDHADAPQPPTKDVEAELEDMLIEICAEYKWPYQKPGGDMMAEHLTSAFGREAIHRARPIIESACKPTGAKRLSDEELKRIVRTVITDGEFCNGSWSADALQICRAVQDRILAATPTGITQRAGEMK